MITSEQIKGAMAQGVVFTCAMCLKFWWGVDRNFDGCKAVHDRTPCAGPFGKMAYPEYEGPLKGRMHTACFVCGAQPDAVIEVLGKGRVGVCKEHVGAVEQFSRRGERPPFVTHQHLPVLE